MSYICYVPKGFSAKTEAIIDQANRIIEEYQAQGFSLTLRQLYYQFVARDLIPNVQKEYDRIGTIINNGRLAGLINWEAIEDRTRNLQALSHWSNPASIIQSAAYSYRIDKWERQPYRIEVWIEKDALVGVLERPCTNWDIAYFSCRGYTSQSEMWRAGKRLIEYSNKGQKTVILHLGDHDPSGLDMTRDIEERLYLFMTHHGADPVDVFRIGLNRDQVDQYNPPPNPAKLTDSRAPWYIAEHGRNSWALDALEPKVIEELILEAIDKFIDKTIYNEDLKKEDRDKERLNMVADRWHELVEDNGL